MSINMKSPIALILWISFSTILFSCRNPQSNETLSIGNAPDYSSESCWFKGHMTGTDPEKPVDVFYIAPTCTWAHKDSSGQLYHFMDVYDEGQKTLVNPSLNLASHLFEKSCNFYSPYYRQISMESWFEPMEEIDRRYVLAHQDIAQAFQYYMEHINQGRPFILAGHSQGGKAVIELLKHQVTESQYQNMVAAYVFGFSISQKELNEYPFLKGAESANDPGIICYNSVSIPEAISPVLKDNILCINPINWSTDTTYAPASANIGSVFFDAQGQSDTLFHQVGVRIDPDIHTLIIDGLDDEHYFIKEIEKLFPKGNYHIEELNLYYLNIQQNLAERIRHFQKKVR